MADTCAAPIVGIDLDDRWEEVRRLVVHGFSRRAAKAGIDLDEDLLPEVYRRILVANAGRAPYTPARGSWAGYIYLQTQSALGNLIDKRQRRSWEVVGFRCSETGETTDAALADLAPDGVQWGSALPDPEEVAELREALDTLDPEEWDALADMI